MSSITHITGHHVIRDLLALLDETDLTQAVPQPDVVHRIRVAIKKVRAWLKLCRNVSGESTDYQQLVARLRDLSNALAGQRDCEVARQTLAKLVRKYPGKKAQHLVDEVSRSLSEESSAVFVAPAVRDRIDELRQDLLPLLQLEIPAETGQTVINQTYTKMCQRGKLALKTKQCEVLHAWRKQVKTLGYQLEIADRHQGQQTKLYAKITKLGNKLGKIHDLCFLQTMLISLATTDRCHEDMKPLYKRIERERDGLSRLIRKQHGLICRQGVVII